MPSSYNVRSRARERNGVLSRPEFMSLNQQPVRGGAKRPGQVKHQTSQQSEEPADSGSKDKREPNKMPEEDCMQLNPSFKGIAMNSLLAIDICLSKRMGVCVYTSSSWGGCRSMVALLALTGHGITWIIGTIVCLTRSNTLAGQEVLVNLLLGKCHLTHLVQRIYSTLQYKKHYSLQFRGKCCDLYIRFRKTNLCKLNFFHFFSMNPFLTSQLQLHPHLLLCHSQKAL